jgi:hypothetical protein
MKKYAGRSGFDLFRGNIWYSLVGLSKATNYCTPDVQYIHIQGNRLSNRRELRSELRCSIRKTGIINGAILSPVLTKSKLKSDKQIAPIRIINNVFLSHTFEEIKSKTSKQ